jgi:hypothetical protein
LTKAFKLGYARIQHTWWSTSSTTCNHSLMKPQVEENRFECVRVTLSRILHPVALLCLHSLSQSVYDNQPLYYTSSLMLFVMHYLDIVFTTSERPTICGSYFDKGVMQFHFVYDQRWGEQCNRPKEDSLNGEWASL